MSKLKCAIIGTGGISKKHFNGYSALKDEVEIAAICDIKEDILKQASQTYGVSDTYTDYRKILERRDIDFVVICLPNYLHAPVTIEALESGKHVHCEKPMAMNAVEARQMYETSRRTGMTLMVGLNNRFTPYALYIKKLVEEGFFGDMYFAKCGWQRRYGLPYRGWFGESRYAGGGALIDLGVHFIDLTMHIMGFPDVRAISAKTYRKFGGGGAELYQLYAYEHMPVSSDIKFDVDDLAVGFIELKNDASIQFEISWASNIEKEKVFYSVYGTKAGLSFSHCFDDDVPELKLFGSLGGQLVDIVPLINANSFRETEFSHFVDCIRNNSEPVIAPPEQGVKMMEIIDAIYLSSIDKKQVVF